MAALRNFPARMGVSCQMLKSTNFHGVCEPQESDQLASQPLVFCFVFHIFFMKILILVQVQFFTKKIQFQFQNQIQKPTQFQVVNNWNQNQLFTRCCPFPFDGRLNGRADLFLSCTDLHVNADLINQHFQVKVAVPPSSKHQLHTSFYTTLKGMLYIFVWVLLLALKNLEAFSCQKNGVIPTNSPQSCFPAVNYTCQLLLLSQVAYLHNNSCYMLHCMLQK